MGSCDPPCGRHVAVIVVVAGLSLLGGHCCVDCIVNKFTAETWLQCVSGVKFCKGALYMCIQRDFL